MKRKIINSFTADIHGFHPFYDQIEKAHVCCGTPIAKQWQSHKGENLSPEVK